MSTGPANRHGSGDLRVESAELPDLPVVLPHAERLDGLVVTDTQYTPGVSGRLSGGWTLEFTYRGHTFSIDTNYHAALTEYTAREDGCPAALLQEVVTHFEKVRPCRPPSAAAPPLNRRRLLLLFLIALAVAVPLTLWLVWARGE